MHSVKNSRSPGTTKPFVGQSAKGSKRRSTPTAQRGLLASRGPVSALKAAWCTCPTQICLKRLNWRGKTIYQIFLNFRPTPLTSTLTLWDVYVGCYIGDNVAQEGKWTFTVVCNTPLPLDQYMYMSLTALQHYCETTTPQMRLAL